MTDPTEIEDQIHEHDTNHLPSCTLYLARHGQTVLNANGLLRGHLDPPLDSYGQEQASALGAEVAGFRPELILCSPLRRAVETARAIGQRCGLTPKLEPDLMDRDYGAWAGNSSEDVIARWGSIDDAPGVEPIGSVTRRAIAALDRVADRRRVVMVAHEAVNTVLLSHLEPSNWSSHDQVPQETGCYNVLHRRGGRWAVSEVNISPHGTGAT